MKVANIMRQPAVTIPASASIAAAAEKMRDMNVGILTVLDHEWAMQARVRDVMSPEVRICFDRQTIEDAAAAMGDHQVRRLPVCDDAERLVGILSVDMIAEEYSEHLAGETLGEIVEKRGWALPGSSLR